MLTILAGVATWEREIMLERQREGIAKAKALGKNKGRPQSIDRAQIREADLVAWGAANSYTGVTDLPVEARTGGVGS